MKNKCLYILGIRGIPACHGGFETFAEYLSLYLIDKKWDVYVYCQIDGKGRVTETFWNGIHLINIPISINGSLGTILFDLYAILYSLRRRGVFLTLGYNTAIFNVLLKIFSLPNIINMDGIEWKRSKWGGVAKAWFWLNEWCGSLFSDHMIADHPSIKEHLARGKNTEKITMIPYGGSPILAGDPRVIDFYGLKSEEYAIVIARPEPENSILEIVQAFSRKKRGINLVVLGNYDSKVAYHRKVLSSASDEVKFIGAIYDKNSVFSLRFFANFYIHGHQVGGTNPSLVESLAASNPVLAHNNKFNRWVAQDSALYFATVDECDNAISMLIESKDLQYRLSQAAKRRHKESFQWDDVLHAYDLLLTKFHN